MTEEKFEVTEENGAVLTVDPSNWPEGLVGLHIVEQSVYINDGQIRIVGIPVWNLELGTDL